MILSVTIILVIFILSISDGLPDMGVESLDDMLGLIEDESKINQLIKSMYKDSGIYISVYVDHMVDQEEAQDTINSLAGAAYHPENCLFIIYFDNGVTYEYYFAPGKEVVKQISQETLKDIFDSTATSYNEIGGEGVLLLTLERIQQCLPKVWKNT